MVPDGTLRTVDVLLTDRPKILKLYLVGFVRNNLPQSSSQIKYGKLSFARKSSFRKFNRSPQRKPTKNSFWVQNFWRRHGNIRLEKSSEQERLQGPQVSVFSRTRRFLNFLYLKEKFERKRFLKGRTSFSEQEINVMVENLGSYLKSSSWNILYNAGSSQWNWTVQKSCRKIWYVSTKTIPMF